MIIRYGGGNSGIKEYLENGRKVDRHFTRDEMDRRIPIDGDLVVTDSVISSIADKGQERYLHLSMSFNEPDITEDKIREVYEQYIEQFMHAYKRDEFNVYAEIHWPKIKESYNHNTDRMEPRFPHVHIVIPKKNMLTGGYLNPQGIHGTSLKYFDAIQEKLNRDNGLSSPRNSPRVGTNHYESALGKYKDKEFRSKNGELKRDIFNAMTARDVRTDKAFAELVAEYGEVKIRNQGRPNQYLAVKVAGDQKYTNLKGNIFGSDYIRDRALVLDPISDAQIEKRVSTWREIQSKEIKFISNASTKVKDTYKGLSLPERRTYLAEREARYDQLYRQAGERNFSRGKLPSLRERNYQSGDFEFAGGFQAEGASDLHELRASNVDHFGSYRESADRLLLSRDEDDDVHHLSPDRSSGLRHNLYAGGPEGGRRELAAPPFENSKSSVLAYMLHSENEAQQKQTDLQRFADIRKNLDPLHLLAYAQLKYGLNPDEHPVSKARDGSPRIKAGKLNLNVSDFLTKHIGLDWKEASGVLETLYEKQRLGIKEKPRSRAEHTEEWRRFRDDVYPKNIKTYDELKNQIRVSYDLGLKVINSEYYARRKSITQDDHLTRTDRHYFRSIVILEKLQKVEALQKLVSEQNSLKDQVKYPYSSLFYDYATKNEEVSMKVLDEIKRRLVKPTQEQEGVNTIGSARPMTPETMPSGAEAAKRAKLIAQMQHQEREAKELRIKLADLRPQPLANGGVSFNHKDHGKQIFINHPDRLELDRKTEPDEVGVALIYATERFGSPLDVKGTEDFKRQAIEVAAERDMDIVFTDDKMNEALEQKRIELGMEPLERNRISAADLEIDKTLPLNQAVDKALLASKVAELDQLRPSRPVERVMNLAMVSDADDRHAQIALGMASDSQIRDFAKTDLQAFAHLEGKAEQRDLAISMANAMDNEHYSSYVTENGPKEFSLTLDAARVIEERGMLAKEDRKAADFAAMENEPVRFELHDPRSDAEYSYSTAAEVQEKAAELGASRYSAVMRDDTRQQVIEKDGNWFNESAWIAEREAEREQPTAPQQHELSAEERAEINKARDDFGMPPLPASDSAQPAPREEFDEDLARLDLHDQWMNDRIEDLADRDVRGESTDSVAEFKKLSSLDNPERESWIDAEIHRMKAEHERMGGAPDRDAPSPTGDAQPQIDSQVMAKVVAFNAVNQAANDESGSYIENIMRQGTLVEANIRHEEVESGFIDSDRIIEIAKQDLDSFHYLQDKPEQQKLAVLMGKQMENEHYSGYIRENAPKDFAVTVQAAQIVSDSQPTIEQAAQPEKADRDMEP